MYYNCSVIFLPSDRIYYIFIKLSNVFQPVKKLVVKQVHSPQQV